MCIRDSPHPESAPLAGSAERGAAEAAARRAADALPPWSAWLSLTVGGDDEGAAAALLRRFGATFLVDRAAGRVRFAIENRRELSIEEHPWAIDLIVRLGRQGVEVLGLLGG